MSSNGRLILDLNTAYEQQAKASVLSPSSDEQLLVHTLNMHNRYAGTNDMAACVKLANADYLVGLLTSGAVVADVTSALQAGTVQNLFSTTNNDGFLVQSKRKFNLMGFTVSQAATGSPVYTYEYYNGSAYTALTDMIETPTLTATGDKLFVFSSPRDWALGSTAGVGGSSSYYSIKVIATTAPSQAVRATAVWVGKFLHFQEAVAENGNLHISYPYENPKLLNGGEGIMPYFKNASPSNLVTGLYQSI